MNRVRLRADRYRKWQRRGILTHSFFVDIVSTAPDGLCRETWTFDVKAVMCDLRSICPLPELIRYRLSLRTSRDRDFVVVRRWSDSASAGQMGVAEIPKLHDGLAVLGQEIVRIMHQQAHTRWVLPRLRHHYGASRNMRRSGRPR